MDASELSWADVDQRAKSIGFKDRSKYIQYLVEKDISRSKYELSLIFKIIVLLELSAILMILTVL